jgi:lipopolysaccharide biosynthesis glycosyltransferase
MHNNYISVVLCFDANYAPYASVTSCSVAKNANTPIFIYWICPTRDFDKISPYQKALKKLNIEISLIKSDHDFRDFMISTPMSNYINEATYLRLLIPELINEEKVIYLDSDLLVLSDLTAIFETKMQDLAIAGVEDPWGLRSKIPRDKGDPYVNTGVLLMNLDILRKDNFLQQCELIFKTFKEKITWLDQDIINKYAENKKALIDPKWNRQIIANETNQALWEKTISSSDSRIIHFAGRYKPWQEACNPMIRDFWWRYAGELKIPNLKLLPIKNIVDAKSYAHTLDTLEMYAEASEVKTKIILNMELQYRKGNAPIDT